jgi:iron complex outermembrane recepter protein
MTRTAAIRLALMSATVLGAMAPAGAWAAADDAAPAPVADAPQTIVVTATRRATSLQDVPINISAVSAKTLQDQRIDDVRDIASATPGLTIRDTGPSNTGTIIIRGLSADDTSSTGNRYDNSLALYLGETPLYADFKFMDINRVESLLGPQGTLYGEGTLAGAIRYIPNRPDPDKWSGSADVRFFGESHAHEPGADVQGTVNIPIVKGLIALRSSVGYWDNPGFIDYVGLVNNPGVSNPQPGGLIGNYAQQASSLSNSSTVIGVNPTTGAAPAGWGTNNATAAEEAANVHSYKGANFEDTLSMRHSLGIFPADWLRVYLTWAHQVTDTDGDQINSGGVLGTGRYEASKRYLEPTHRVTDLYSIETETDIGQFAQLVSDTAWTKQFYTHQGDNTDLLLDLNYGYQLFPQFTSYNETQESRTQFNEELRLVSKHGGPVNWVLGGFYNKMNDAENYHEVVPGYAQWAGIDRPDDWEYASYTRSSNEEKAIYGEATIRLTSKWQVTGGARYFGYNAFINGGTALPLYESYPGVTYSSRSGSTGKNGAVWKGNTSYKITPDLMAYFTFSKGYRLGGVNRVAPCVLPIDTSKQNLCALPNELSYGPDTTYNKELGLRFTLFNGKLRGSIDGYYINWDGIQLAGVTQYGAIGITVNGGKAVSKGIEMNFVANPVPRLTITGDYSYNHAYLTEDVAGLIHYGNGGYLKTDALAGDRLPGSPMNAGSLGADYTLPVGRDSMTFDWTAAYMGNVMTRPGDQGYGQTLPGYLTNRAFLAYRFREQGFEVKLFADNIFDKYAVTSVSNNLSSRIINSGFASRYYTQSVLTPRRAGIELTKTF